MAVIRPSTSYQYAMPRVLYWYWRTGSAVMAVAAVVQHIHLNLQLYPTSMDMTGWGVAKHNNNAPEAWRISTF